MFFRKKKEIVVNLVDILKERQDEIFVCPQFMAVWSPGLNKAIFIYGDYTNLNEEEANRILQAKVIEAHSSMN